MVRSFLPRSLSPVRAALQTSPEDCLSHGSHLRLFRDFLWELLHCLVPDLGNLLWLPSSASSPSAHPHSLFFLLHRQVAGGTLGDGSSLGDSYSLRYSWSLGILTLLWLGERLLQCCLSPLSLLLRSRERLCVHNLPSHIPGDTGPTPKSFSALTAQTHRVEPTKLPTRAGDVMCRKKWKRWSLCSRHSNIKLFLKSIFLL